MTIKRVDQVKPVLVLEDLSLTIDGAQIFKDINLSISSHEIVVITGVSGIGKSKLFQAVLDLLPDYAQLEGTVYYQSEHLNKTRLIQLRGQKITYIPQQISALDPLMKVAKQVQGIARDHLLSTQLLEHYQLPESIGRCYPFQLSGGMARRVLIASALINDADLILADEPTTGLNAKLIDIMVNHFIMLKNQGKSIVVITHDLDVAARLADRILCFSDKTLSPISSLSDNKLNVLKSSFEQHHTRCPLQQLDAVNVSFSYPNQPLIFNQINLRLRAGKITGLMSPSGSGKTTLANLLGGFILPINGEITLNGQPINRMKRGAVQLIHQHPELSVNPHWTIRQILLESGDENLLLWQQLRIDDHWLNRKASELSGGQLQRVCIARALNYSATRFIIADEITSQLDIDLQQMIWQCIIEHCQKQNIGLLIISHHYDLLQQLCHNIVQLTDLNQHQCE